MSQSALAPFRSGTNADLIHALVAEFLRTWESPNTRGAYRVDLQLWTKWCFARELDALNVNKGAVMAFLADRMELGDAETTRARRLSGIASWYNYLMATDKVAFNPANLPKSNRPKSVSGESTTLALSNDQIEELIALADEDGLRTSALVAVLVITGVRISELLNANVEDITQQDGAYVLPIVGKGRRKRMAPLPPPAYRRLMAYLHSRIASTELVPTAVSGAGSHRPLFLAENGARLSRRQVDRDLKRIASYATGSLGDLGDRLSPHVTRHSFATGLLQDEVPLRDVQYAMGHQSPVSTERYDHSRLSLDNHPSYRRATQLRT